MKKWETSSMKNLEMKSYLRGDGKTVRFQDYVVVTHSYRDVGRGCTYYEFSLYRPVETEDEAGVSFVELRLECIDDLFPLYDLGGYETEGEALLSAFNHCLQL